MSELLRGVDRGRPGLVFCVLAVLLVAPAARAGALLLTPLDPAWVWLEELTRRGEVGLGLAAGTLLVDLDALEGSAHPGAVSAQTWAGLSRPPAGLGAGVRPLLTVIGSGSDPHRQLRPSYLDLRDGDAVDPPWRARVGLIGRANLHERVQAGVHFTFDSRGDNDPLNRTRDFVQLDASNNFDAAWVRAELGPAAFTLGRVPMGWGPEERAGLLLSATAPAPDMLHVALRWGPHRLQTFAGQLSTEELEGTSIRRYLYGHRADLYFLDRRLRLALSETAVVAGGNESLNLRYLNPIPLWAQIQVELDGDSGTQVNVIDMIDGEFVHGLGGWSSRWYGSFAVDDIQIHPDGRDTHPDQLAWSAGLDLARAAWLAGYTYRRIGTWTYLHRGEGTGHANYQRPLGAPEGPDTDRHHLRLQWRSDARTRWWIEGERRRRGINRILTDEPRRGQVDLPFPRGTVEKSWITTLGLETAVALPYATQAKATLVAALHAIENVNNESGRDEDVWEVRLVLDLAAPLQWWSVAE